MVGKLRERLSRPASPDCHMSSPSSTKRQTRSLPRGIPVTVMENSPIYSNLGGTSSMAVGAHIPLSVIPIELWTLAELLWLNKTISSVWWACKTSYSPLNSDLSLVVRHVPTGTENGGCSNPSSSPISALSHTSVLNQHKICDKTHRLTLFYTFLSSL